MEWGKRPHRQADRLFKGGNGFVDASHLEQNHALLVAKEGVLGVVVNGLLDVGERRIPVSLPRIRVGDGEPDEKVVGIEILGLAEFARGACFLRLFQQHRAECHVGPRAIRANLNRPGDGGGGLVQPPFFLKRRAQVSQRHLALRPYRNGDREEADGFFEPAGVLQFPAEVAVHPEAVGVHASGGLEQRDGERASAHL